MFQKRRPATDVIVRCEAIACSDAPTGTSAMFRSRIERQLPGTGAGVALLEALITTVAGAASATVGVLVGGVVTRRGQDHQWSRDQQLVAYQELLSHYAKFTMVIKRAHADRRGWDYDWAEWSAVLTRVSLIAPAEVAREVDSPGFSRRQQRLRPGPLLARQISTPHEWITADLDPLMNRP
ncbi:hypothetical protein [Kitasatospora sp. NPDC090091]|uniref:hypothetical protein n=1 Tax=Kitasatospora sp. NPDC090091 TaxID=3364081 RepID=UPI0037FA31B0